MERVEVVRHLNGPPQRVWDVYTDHAGWKEWAGFRNSYLEADGSPDKNGSGAIRVFDGGLGMRAREEVVDFEPPKRMTYRLLGWSPLKNHRGEVLFESEGEGTRITWRCQIESRIPGLGGPMQRFITGIFRKALDGLARHAFPDSK